MYLVAFVWAPGTGKYYTDGPAEMNSPGNWWVPEVFLGDHSDQCSNGHTYRIVMVLMSAQAQAANAAYHSANYDAPYSPSTFRSITAGFPTWTAIATRAGTPPAGC
jgi:hypothetical protein